MSMSDELGKLGELHQRGVLSDDEFARAKARVLNGASRTPPESVVTAVNALHRSRSDRWLGGVCGGLAQVSGVAAWIWRLVFVLLVACAGTGLLIYVLMWLLVPLEPSQFRGTNGELHTG